MVIVETFRRTTETTKRKERRRKERMSVCRVTPETEQQVDEIALSSNANATLALIRS